MIKNVTKTRKVDTWLHYKVKTFLFYFWVLKAKTTFLQTWLVDEVSVDEMSVDEMSVDEVSVDEVSVNEMSVDKVSVDEVSVDEVSVDEVSVDEMSVDGVSVDEFFPPGLLERIIFSRGGVA